MIPKITKIQYRENYVYHIRFKDGQEGDVDFSYLLWGEVFQPLKNKNYFKKAFIGRFSGTITWPNEADVAPETLYKKITGSYSYL